MGQDQKKRRGKAPAREVSPAVPASYHTPASLTGLSPNAQKRHERFLAEYNGDMRAIISSTVLQVLVWGPGVDVDSTLGEKRWQIRKALRDRGHTAHFSEEIEEAEDLQKLLKGKEQDMKTLLQAKRADFIIALLDERTLGVAVELRLCARRDVAAKICVFAPESLKGAYIDTAVLSLYEGGNGAVSWYTPETLEESFVLTDAVNRVEERRIQYASLRVLKELE